MTSPQDTTDRAGGIRGIPTPDNISNVSSVSKNEARRVLAKVKEKLSGRDAGMDGTLSRVGQVWIRQPLPPVPRIRQPLPPATRIRQPLPPAPRIRQPLPPAPRIRH